MRRKALISDDFPTLGTPTIMTIRGSESVGVAPLSASLACATIARAISDGSPNASSVPVEWNSRGVVLRT